MYVNDRAIWFNSVKTQDILKPVFYIRDLILWSNTHIDQHTSSIALPNAYINGFAAKENSSVHIEIASRANNWTNCRFSVFIVLQQSDVSSISLGVWHSLSRCAGKYCEISYVIKSQVKLFFFSFNWLSQMTIANDFEWANIPILRNEQKFAFASLKFVFIFVQYQGRICQWYTIGITGTDKWLCRYRRPPHQRVRI